MCEIRTVIIAATVLLAAGFCINEVNSEKKKLGHNSHLKGDRPCEKEYKKFCLNGGECFHLNDEDIVGCNCKKLYGGKRCEKYKWWT